MSITQGVALTLGLALAVSTIVRIPAAIRGHNLNMLIAHGLVTVIILLSVAPVYEAVDALLGGINITNFISHLCFPLVFLFGGIQIAKGLGRPDLKRRLVNWAGLSILTFSILVTGASFIAIGPSTTSAGLGDAAGQPAWIIYRAASYLYCSWAGFVLARPLLSEARDHPHPRMYQVSQLGLGIAMVAVTLLPFAHLLEFVTGPAVRPLADILVYGGILLAATSTGVTFVARRRYGIKQPARAPGARPAR